MEWNFLTADDLFPLDPEDTQPGEFEPEPPLDFDEDDALLLALESDDEAAASSL